jgi:hypothetical protein
VESEVALARFFRGLGVLAGQFGTLANQCAADLSSVQSEAEPASLAPSPETLAKGEWQRAIVALPGLRTDEGLKTAEIAQAIGKSDVPSVWGNLKKLEERGGIELVPGRTPQRWRLSQQFRGDSAD